MDGGSLKIILAMRIGGNYHWGFLFPKERSFLQIILLVMTGGKYDRGSLLLFDRTVDLVFLMRRSSHYSRLLLTTPDFRTWQVTCKDLKEHKSPPRSNINIPSSFWQLFTLRVWRELKLQMLAGRLSRSSQPDKSKFSRACRCPIDDGRSFIAVLLKSSIFRFFISSLISGKLFRFEHPFKKRVWRHSNLWRFLGRLLSLMHPIIFKKIVS